MVTGLVIASVIVSLNPCFDDWLPQWVDEQSQVVPTTAHGQRLEAIIQQQPDVVLTGSFVNRSLRLALETRVELVTVPYVTTRAEWHKALDDLAIQLQQKQELQKWRDAQQRQLQGFDLANLGNVLVLMPNAYTWGQNSWVAELIQSHNGQLSPLMGTGQLVRLSLEEVLLSTPDTVILEGFSLDYARAHDWLWHRAVQDWLTERRVLEVSGDIAGCSDIRAVDYLQSLMPRQGAPL
ncbi:hypothetical protein [Pseudidiomarina sp.]|uniref:hypothetical protein n=1 Tax=Pseudidiomarina sp. TaxID=2081707 RepID=UPI003A983246